MVTISAAWVLLIGLGAGPWMEDEPSSGGGDESIPSEFPEDEGGAGDVVPGRLVVKLRAPDGGGIEPSALMRMQPGDEEPTAEDHRNYGSLLKLNEAFGLAKMRGLFFDIERVDAKGAGRSQEEVVARIRERFPERAARAAITAPLPDLTRYVVMEFEEGVDLEEALRRYREDPLVESVQRDRYLEVDDVPNDPFFHSKGSWGQPEDDLWGLKRINIERAWERSKGAGIVVAVVDSGVDFDHPDLEANLWTNPGEVPDNGIDDDGNGFVDDVRGWDFSNGDNDPTDDTRVGHGTHVSGIVAAVGDNGIGVVGVAPEATVMAVKGVDDRGRAEFSVLAPAVFYAVANGADVINNSWGPGTSFQIPVAVEDVVRFAHGMGAVVVFAAGNDADVVAQQSPLNLREPIVVGSSLPDDGKLATSNWGRGIDVIAPGGSSGDPPPAFEDQPRRSILSLRASSVLDPTGMSSLILDERYLRLSGTSMAAPHVSGLAALVLSAHPTFSNEDVRQAIRSSAADVGDAGFDLLHGFGRIDAGAALEIEAPLTVRIDQPTENAAIGVDSVNVTGAVGGEALASARVFLSRLDALGNLEPIGPEHIAATEGTLATLDASALAEGPYLIRLVALDRDGRRFEDAVQVSKQTTVIERLTDDALHQGEPSVSGRYAAWTEDDFNQPEPPATRLVLLDLRDRSRRDLPLPSGRPDAMALSDDHLAYAAGEEGTLRLIDLQSGLDRPFHQPDSDNLPVALALSGDRIVWEDPSENRILLHEIGGGRTRSVSETRPGATYPALDGDRIVWTEEADVVLHDLRDGSYTTISEPADGACYYPSISGDDVVWSYDPDRRNERFEVFHRDLRTGLVRKIVEARPRLQALKVSSGRAVWSDLSRGNRDVFVYDLATGATRAVTNTPDFENIIEISGRNLVWNAFRRRDREAEANYETDVDFHHFPADAPAARAGFVGGVRLLDQIGFAFNIAPDRHAATVLFDSFDLELDEGRDAQSVATRTETVVLPVMGNEEEIGVRQIVRGYASIDPGLRALLVANCCGRTELKDLTGTAGDYQFEFDATLGVGQEYSATFLLLVERAGSESDGSGYVTIDSLDVEIDPSSGTGTDGSAGGVGAVGGSG